VSELFEELESEGFLVRSPVFRRSREGKFEPVFVTRDHARSHERFRPLIRVLVQIAGDHWIVASREIIEVAHPSPDPDPTVGSQVRLISGRFRGEVGEVVGIVHEATLDPWLDPAARAEYERLTDRELAP
jgi:hypothetical protein